MNNKIGGSVNFGKYLIKFKSIFGPSLARSFAHFAFAVVGCFVITLRLLAPPPLLRLRLRLQEKTNSLRASERAGGRTQKFFLSGTQQNDRRLRDERLPPPSPLQFGRSGDARSLPVSCSLHLATGAAVAARLQTQRTDNDNNTQRAPLTWQDFAAFGGRRRAVCSQALAPVHPGEQSERTPPESRQIRDSSSLLRRRTIRARCSLTNVKMQNRARAISSGDDAPARRDDSPLVPCTSRHSHSLAPMLNFRRDSSSEETLIFSRERRARAEPS